MKKSVKLLVITIVAITMLALGSGAAFAAEYDHCADALKNMGLFQGGANGYELDRQATRAEAAVMLVRLLGAEEEALAGEFNHPFTDVPEWASPYIAYMYDAGLTKGASATTFNSQGFCDLQMFSTFVLRALGYEEAAGDFTYATAADVAANLGVADIITASGTFKRDNLAAIAYTALFTQPKGAETTLLEQLIEAGAVDAEAAQPYLTLFADYAKIQAANAQLAGLGNVPLEMKLLMDMNMDMGEEGNLAFKLDSLMQMDMSAIKDPYDLREVLAALDKIKFGMTNKVAVSGTLADMENIDITLDMHLLNSVLYLNHNLGQVLEDETIPAKLKLDLNAVLAMVNLDELGLEEMMDMGNLFSGLLPGDPYAPHYGISHTKAIKATTLADGGVSYEITMIDISNELIQSLATTIYGNMMGMPEMAEALKEVDIETSIDGCVYTLDKDGNMRSQQISVGIVQTMFPGTEDELTMKMDMKMDMEITKTGTDVKITLPGKDADYTDLFELLNNLMSEPMSETGTEITVETL